MRNLCGSLATSAATLLQIMRHSFWKSLLACAFALSSAHGSWNIQTFSGNGNPGFKGDYGKAKDAQLDKPYGIVRGPDGALWFCEYGGNRIRKVRPDGFIFTVVGNGKKEFAGDGRPALEASLNMPHEVRFDALGDLYISDMGNHAIRKVDMKTGIIRTFAGTGFGGYSGDGEAASIAHLKQPSGIQFGPDGDLYICDTGNHAIRKVDMKTGDISTFAGTGTAGDTPDGSPIEGAQLRAPRSIDFDKEGNPWVVTRDGNQVIKFDLKTRRIMLMAGTGAKGFVGDGGAAVVAQFNSPKGIALAPNGNAYVVDSGNNCVRKINVETGVLERVAGSGERGDGPDGNPLQCLMSKPQGIFVDKDGSIFVSDSDAHRIRVLREN